MNLAGKALEYFRENGARDTVRKAQNWYRVHFTDVNDYQAFLRRNRISQAQLRDQKKTVFQRNLKFSIIVPLYRTPEKYLREMIQSVREQTYGNWELCLADGSGIQTQGEGVGKTQLTDILKEYSSKDGRIRFRTLPENLGIAGNTNAALDMAQGDYFVLADHDDTLAPDALFECASVLEQYPETELLYSDEDKISFSGKKYFEPNFKPDFNPDYLYGTNYICHLFVFRKDFYERFGGFCPQFDGAQDYDLILRYTEKAENIKHIPKVLYHWRKNEGSTAADPEKKLYAYEHGAKALQEHWDRVGIPARVEMGEVYGTYHTIYQWPELKKQKPLVSVLVPNKDHAEDLKKCLESVESRSVYRNLEWIIVENNSTEPETFALYRELEKKKNVRILTWDGSFNYSGINNLAAGEAGGEYLLLLNNDIIQISPESIQEMLGICMRDDVAAVGAKLYYPDDTIQHAGVVIGVKGIADHAFKYLPSKVAGYGLRAITTQDYNAVTAACMLVKKKDFEEADGLDPEFQVAFNDIDLCLRLRKNGKRIVFTPFAEFYHCESKSRGADETPEHILRFQKEIDAFVERYRDILEKGDPWYNPNLNLLAADFSLKKADIKWEHPKYDLSKFGLKGS
jgi:GT2 family glycosyltransferase